MIYLLTGAIQSGKTSALLKWVEGRTDVNGLLTPVRGDKRFFHDISTGEEFSMEAGTGEAEVLSIGRFVFSRKNFEKAEQILRHAMNKGGWLVIDEIGPLELRGEGFHPLLLDIFSRPMDRLILVVREGLAKQVTESYNLVSPRFISPEMLMDIT